MRLITVFPPLPPRCSPASTNSTTPSPKLQPAWGSNMGSNFTIGIFGRTFLPVINARGIWVSTCKSIAAASFRRRIDIKSKSAGTAIGSPRETNNLFADQPFQPHVAGRTCGPFCSTRTVLHSEKAYGAQASQIESPVTYLTLFLRIFNFFKYTLNLFLISIAFSVSKCLVNFSESSW